MFNSTRPNKAGRFTATGLTSLSVAVALIGATVLGPVGHDIQAGAEQQPSSVAASPERLSDFDPAGEDQLLGWINIMRAQVGAPPVAIDPFLVNYARGQAQLMAAQGGLSHSDLGSRLAGWSAGENVGYGSTTNQIHDAFVADAPHYAIMVTPS